MKFLKLNILNLFILSFLFIIKIVNCEPQFVNVILNGHFVTLNNYPVR